MSELRADDVGISSVRRMGVGDLATARAPDRVNRSQPEPDEVRQTLICAAITEVRSDRQTKLGGDYFFEQLPAPHDQIVILNRWGSYDILRVLHSVHEPETAVYVRWVARGARRLRARLPHREVSPCR
jgi:hypothetical protein